MRIPGVLPSLRALMCGGGRWRCTLIATALGMIVLGVVGMRHLPPRMLWRPATVPRPFGRRVPALSLAELSVRRT